MVILYAAVGPLSPATTSRLSRALRTLSSHAPPLIAQPHHHHHHPRRRAMASDCFNDLLHLSGEDLMSLGLPVLPPVRPGTRPRLLLLTLVVLNLGPTLIAHPHPLAPTPKNHRLMLVVLLGLPRNLIVLEDVRLTRNNLLTSLASLGGANPPIPAPQASQLFLQLTVAPTLPEPPPTTENSASNKRFTGTDQTPTDDANGGARDPLRELPVQLFFSDDDLELETPLRLKRPVITPKWGSLGNPYTSSPVFNDVATKPTLLALFDTTGPRRDRVTLPIALATAETPLRRLLFSGADDAMLPPLAVKKRTKAQTKHTIQQLLMKRKLIHSKDLQVELGVTSPIETKFITTAVLDLGKRTYLKQPVLQLLTLKNKLIQQLNQRWNRAGDDDKQRRLDDPERVPARYRRKRRWLDDELSLASTDGDVDDFPAYDDVNDFL